MNKAVRHAVTVSLALVVAVSGGPPASAADTTIFVDWTTSERSVTDQAFGVNLYGGSSDLISSQATYQSNLRHLDPGFVRFHYAGMTNSSATDERGWVDEAQRTWDSAKIARVFDNYQASGVTADILVNIPDFPSWMKRTTVTVGGESVQLLDPSEYDNYAIFCADLVRILKAQNRGVDYISITNEKDDQYYVKFKNAGQPDRMNELVTLYNKAAAAVKAEDPAVKVGGLEFARPDLTDSVTKFVQGATTLDFLPFHFYATGDPWASNASVWDRTRDLGRHARDIRGILNANGRSGTQLINSEYNINYTSQQDYKQTLPEGAVYDALVWKQSLENGASATAVWNDRDGYYGLMNNDANNSLRIVGQTFNLANKHLTGTQVSAGPSTASDVEALATKNGSRRTIMLVNRSEVDQVTSLYFTGYAGNGLFDRYEIARPYTQTNTTVRLTGNWESITLPPSSVTFLVGTA